MNDKIEQLKLQRQAKEFLEMMHADELERLEHMGELMVFSDISTADYLEASHPEDWRLKSKLEPYHPLGSVEYERELNGESQQPGMKQQRFLTHDEASVFMSRLTKRRDHGHECTCEFCRPHGATHHIKSFPMKPANFQQPAWKP